MQRSQPNISGQPNISDEGRRWPQQQAFLLLTDGSLFPGQGFGATGPAIGELCFNTSMTGYQEILTDPSYAGQLITFTFPHIGNVGANAQDHEAKKPAARGMITRCLPTAPSNYRSDTALEDWLKQQNVTGIAGVDTRALTRHIRTRGAQNALILYEPEVGITEEYLDEMQQKLAEHPSLKGMELAQAVTCKEPHDWGMEGTWRWNGGYKEQEAGLGNPASPERAEALSYREDSNPSGGHVNKAALDTAIQSRYDGNGGQESEQGGEPALSPVGDRSPIAEARRPEQGHSIKDVTPTPTLPPEGGGSDGSAASISSPLEGGRLGGGCITAAPSSPHIVALDFGIKHNILRCLTEVGCRVTVLPAAASASDVLGLNPDGIFLSNGPGDPEATARYALPVIQALLEASGTLATSSRGLTTGSSLDTAIKSRYDGYEEHEAGLGNPASPERERSEQSIANVSKHSQGRSNKEQASLDTAIKSRYDENSTSRAVAGTAERVTESPEQGRFIPIFGICMGHQLLARALGCGTEKMHQGHRGANHPVQDLRTGKVEITSQNHGFVVSDTALPSNVEVTHRSLFDGTIQGIQLKGCPVFSVQGHPEASPGPRDSFYLFEQFFNTLAMHQQKEQDNGNRNRKVV